MRANPPGIPVQVLNRTASDQRDGTFRASGSWEGINVQDMIKGEDAMLGWAVTFLVIALIAAALGFGGIAGTSAGIAQVLFVIFLVLFVVAMIARAVRGKPPV